MANIIVTGTSRGIGKALTGLFASSGHRVLALSRNTTPIDALGLPDVESVACDIDRDADLDRAMETVEAWGRVDVLVHNAGQLANRPFVESDRRTFESIYAVNVFAVAELTRRVLPFMNQDGHVVAVSSMGAVQGVQKFPGLAAYTSSKAALIALVEVWAEEFKESGPRFNALAIGAVQTEMLESAFPGYKAPVSAEEMAAYIHDFALTGQQLFNGKVLQVSNSVP